MKRLVLLLALVCGCNKTPAHSSPVGRYDLVLTEVPPKSMCRFLKDTYDVTFAISDSAGHLAYAPIPPFVPATKTYLTATVGFDDASCSMTLDETSVTGDIENNGGSFNQEDAGVYEVTSGVVSGTMNYDFSITFPLTNGPLGSLVVCEQLFSVAGIKR